MSEKTYTVKEGSPMIGGRPMYWRMLPDHTTVPADRNDFAAMYQSSDDRRVAADTVGDAWISTVFLGLDHSFGDGPPVLFETMVFRGENGGDDERRYSTWDEAVAGHNEVVAELRAARRSPR